MKEKLLKILGDYKVIGDTTYGLGFKEANELADKIINEFIQVISTHAEGEGHWCDTGDDMEWACRSECTDSAIERIKSN